MENLLKLGGIMNNSCFWDVQASTNNLEKPVDDQFIKKNYKNQNYVPASLTIKEANVKLNNRWSCEVIKAWSEKLLDYDIVFFALVRVTVPGLGWRECIGGASFRDHVYGKGVRKSMSELRDSDLQSGQSCDMYKKAAVDGTKKALGYFGICEEVYWPSDNDNTYSKASDGGILLNGKRVGPAPVLEKKYPELVDYQQLGPLGDKMASIIDLFKMSPSDLVEWSNKAGTQTPIDNTNIAKFRIFMKEQYQKRTPEK